MILDDTVYPDYFFFEGETVTESYLGKEMRLGISSQTRRGSVVNLIFS